MARLGDVVIRMQEYSLFYKSFGSNGRHIANTVPLVCSANVIMLCIIASPGCEDVLREYKSM
jgi:hypothetical protein